jgi:hypothetical protein
VTESDCYVESHSCTSSHLQYSGQYYFCISEFGLSRIEKTDPEGTWLPLYADEARALLAKAENVLGNSSTATQFERNTAGLLLMADTLRRALATPLPVELTTDETAPVLYRIIYGNAALEYNPVPTDNMFDAGAYALNLISLADTANVSSGQAWYFVKGTDVGQYYLCPLDAAGMVLGSNPAWSHVMEPGDNRVWGENRSDATRVVQWTMAQKGDGVFNISPVDNAGLLLGRFSGGSQYLGYVDAARADEALFCFGPYVESETSIGRVEPVYDGSMVIYDLSGRRLQRVTAPGMYIVNGKKMYLMPACLRR